jgi:hypothetical protein
LRKAEASFVIECARKIQRAGGERSGWERSEEVAGKRPLKRKRERLQRISVCVRRIRTT